MSDVALDAAPIVPVAVKVTGLPVRPVAVAVSVLEPAVEPSVHDVRAAIPSELVATVLPLAGDVVPPPAVTANVTLTLATALPLASFTITLGGVGKVELADAVWLLPAFTAICVAAPAVNAMVGLPLVMATPSIVAEIVVLPTIGELIVAL